MHVIVIGAGLAGVSAAWYLHQAGHEVTVLERRDAPAQETSHANGGQISVSHPEPWANPSAPMTVLRWMGQKGAPLRFGWPPEPARLRWGFAFLRQCLPHRTLRNTVAIARLARHSLAELRVLRGELGLEYDHLARGILHLYFDARSQAHGRRQLRLLQANGIACEPVSTQRCLELEPALAACASKLVGGLYAPEDESGDAHRFVLALAAAAKHAGVAFRYGVSVDGFELRAGRITALELSDAAGRRGVMHADAYVLAAASESKRLARMLGERLPIYPVKGYSVTLRLREPGRAPSISLTDEARRIVCSRLGDRIRIAGTAELCGFDLTLDPERCDNLMGWANEHLPGIFDPASAQFWAGLRPTTPGNVPIIGRARQPNLYYNTGHGSLGWTLACGSAQALADIISGRRPAVDFPFRRL